MRGRSGSDGRSSRGYSNLQQTLSRPHEEIAIIVAGYTDLQPESDGASGTLSETNAKLLLVHAGQKDIMPVKASGKFRLWLKDGELVKYQVTLEGKLTVSTRDGRRDVDVHQTATTLLRDVNATTLDIPDAAKKKLGG
jgi:RNase P/RNase MRP subunit p29